MFTINLGKISYAYEAERKCFVISEKDVPFATSYVVKNPQTGVEKTFNFTHSTGGEFDPKTRWVYKTEDNLLLEVCNDATMAKEAAQNYLKAKLRK